MFRYTTIGLWRTSGCFLRPQWNTNVCYRLLRNEKQHSKSGRWTPSLKDSVHMKDVSFGRLPASSELPPPSRELLPLSLLIKPAIFTVFFCSSSLIGATIWQYENMRRRARSVENKFKDSLRDNIKSARVWFREHINQARRKQGEFRQIMNTWWNSLPEGERVFFPIMFLNGLVLLAWRTPGFTDFMVKYFSSNPFAKAICWPMVFSTFSHYSGLHLLANMIVLHSFTIGIVNTLGKEQFVGFYLSAGVVSSFASHVYKVLTLQSAVSLGASGAVMGVLSYVCFKYPDTLLNVLFLPFITFTAGSAIKVIMITDAMGMLFRWTFFDHAAHFGGALFGIFWYYVGNEYIWKRRGPVLEWWHNIRSDRTPSQ